MYLNNHEFIRINYTWRGSSFPSCSVRYGVISREKIVFATSFSGVLNSPSRNPPKAAHALTDNLARLFHTSYKYSNKKGIVSAI